MNKTKLLAILGIKPIRDLHDKAVAIRLAILVILSQIGDAASTYFGITRGGAEEANPLLALALVYYGWAGFFVAKALGTAILLWMTWRRKWGSLVIIAIYAFIICWNTYTLYLGL